MYLPPKSLVCKHYDRGTCKHIDKFYECYFLHGNDDFELFLDIREGIIKEFSDYLEIIKEEKQKNNDPNNIDY